MNKKLVLANGSVFSGECFGCEDDVICEIVFNTSMVGYQEIMSDPSYTYQGVVMSYPLIGNYGMNDEDFETKRPSMSALIVRDYNDIPSHYQSSHTLSDVLKQYHIAGLSGVDTREIIRQIAQYGTCLGIITDEGTSLEKALEQIKNHELKRDSVSLVSRKSIEVYDVKNYKKHVVAIDCGMKQNIVRSLNAGGCKVTCVPYNTRFEDIETLHPDGLFISNGPGNPEDVKETIELIKHFIGKIPVFGICLGHQLIALAYGAKTYKLKFGHHGANHPIKNLKTNKIEMTSQNHNYAVDFQSLEHTPLEVTHINILDNTIEGLRCNRDYVMSVQYHPESAPGPMDSLYLFDEFIEMMEEYKHA